MLYIIFEKYNQQNYKLDTMQIAVRKANLEDAASITLLSAQLGYSLNVSQTTSYIEVINERDDNIIYVAVVNNSVVCWIHTLISIRLESGIWAEIGGLVVDKDHRGQGIGKVLVDKSKDWCRLKNISVLKVRCNSKRLEAHLFYDNIGFAELKQQKVFGIKI